VSELNGFLRFNNVSLERGGRLLIERLDLALDPGEALHVSGPNGSGKSSLIRLAAGLLNPARGTVERSSLALADDHPALDRELSLGRALRFWSDVAEDAMVALGIGHLAEVPVRLLSSGQVRRATLARVVASRASLWLLDEPLNGLDQRGVDYLDAALAGHLASGGAVVAASHQPLSGTWRRVELGR
jgi:heme exporter protein A